MKNLDAMDENELGKFWAKHQNGRGYKKLFPNRESYVGVVKATSNLACYAINKSSAIYCRKRGDIQQALMYEKSADEFYAKLPNFARW